MKRLSPSTKLKQLRQSDIATVQEPADRPTPQIFWPLHLRFVRPLAHRKRATLPLSFRAIGGAARA